MAHPSTPLARPLYLGTKGKDVVAVKRSLSRAGYMQWGSFTEVYGEHARVAVHDFQKDHGLAPAGYGQRTHNALLAAHRKGSSEWAWDSYSITLMHEEYVLLHISPEERIRKQGIQMLRYLYEHSLVTAYSQARPYPLIHLGDPVPRRLDCSGLAGLSHYAAGARNPNVQGGYRLPWNGEGYTGTLLNGGTRTTKDRLKPLDFVFYGFTTRVTDAFPYGSPTHVAIWEGEGDNVFSMGSYPMRHTYYRYRHDINCYVTYDVVPR